MAALISTWSFSEPGVQKAVDALKNHTGATDAVQLGIHTVELDPSVKSAGYGGLPNAAGNLQLDAAIMTSTGSLGAVMALERFPSAIIPARLVKDYSRHAILSGAGATAFALERGVQPWLDVLTHHSRKRYEEFINGNEPSHFHNYTNGFPHSDTVGMIARDMSGAITAGCASSGMHFKAEGRIGDSPIVGAGLFADSAGAAVASGDGDKMLRFCLSYMVVERMRTGDSPTDACRHAVNRVQQQDDTCQAAIAAMSADGQVGAACTHQGFDVIVWQEGMSQHETRQADGVVSGQWQHLCV